MTDGLADRAAGALALWGGTGRPEFISHRENAVFSVSLPDGAKAALRLHRQGYRTAAEIASELEWAQGLALAGMPVPQPVAARDGKFLKCLPDGTLVSVTSWVEGAPVGEGEQPLSGTLEGRLALHRQIGAMLARLHDLSDGLELGPGFSRPAWDRTALTGPDPAWGRYWENPTLTPGQRDLLLAARAMADAALAEHEPKADIGLIHADALRENIFVTKAGLTLIDFDDAGIGFRLYDLASALSQSLLDPDLPGYAAALVDGYRGQRALGPDAAALLPVFSMLRAFSSAGWVIPRYPAGHPKQAHYRDRALMAARACLDGPPLYRV